MERLSVASLFCGCGGTDVGIKGEFDFLGHHYESNNVDIVYANDIDQNACSLFEQNFGLKPDCNDVCELKSETLPYFDILTGGFPCQSFSIVAQNPKRLGIQDDRGKLFFEMCRILKDKQPLCFIAENVKGLLSVNNGEAFPLIISEFENCGYNITYSILNSMYFGVPQKRERIIIVGIRKDLPIVFDFNALQEKCDLVPLSAVLEDNISDKYYFSQKAVDGMMKKRELMNKGRAQDISKPCNTVGSHLSKVSLNSTDPVLQIGDRFRRFTPREVARIQSFPDSYILSGSESSQYRALGNAIPPVMIWYVARHLFNLLRSIDVDLYRVIGLVTSGLCQDKQYSCKNNQNNTTDVF